jgi:hypothetical protein
MKIMESHQYHYGQEIETDRRMHKAAVVAVLQHFNESDESWSVGEVFAELSPSDAYDDHYLSVALCSLECSVLGRDSNGRLQPLVDLSDHPWLQDS